MNDVETRAVGTVSSACRAVPEDGTGLTIQLLGQFSVSVESRSISDADWYLRKARQVLKLLALAEHHRLHREQVIEALWPHLAPEAASNNLHKALYVARHVLEPQASGRGCSVYLRLQGSMVSLPQPVWTDVQAFDDAATRAITVQSVEAYTQALSLYGGELLPEDRYEDWAMDRREQLSSVHLQLLLQLAEVHQRSGHLTAAMEVAHQAVRQDPFHEEARAMLMVLLAHTGQRYLALRQYEDLRTRLARTLEVEPDPSLQALQRTLRAGHLPALQRAM
jgi:DNA-binding SARP family transcriptional activator